VNVEELRALQDDIWEEYWADYGRRRRKAHREKRRLTKQEWDDVLAALEQGDFIFRMFNCNFAFSVGLIVFTEPQPAGIAYYVPPEHVITLTPDHVPEDICAMWRARSKRGNFDQAFEFFSKFSHSRSNKEKLMFCHKEWPKKDWKRGCEEKRCYDY
jgi:hypothetical protein